MKKKTEPCRFCGDQKKFQVVSPTSDHAWANCFCTKPDQSDLEKAKARGYSNGYATGRKKGITEGRSLQAASDRYREEQAFWDATFISAMNATIIAGNWGTTVDGVHKKWCNGEQYAEGAAGLANDMLKARRKYRP